MDFEDGKEQRLRDILRRMLDARTTKKATEIEQALTGPRAVEELELGHVVDELILDGIKARKPVDRICKYASDGWIGIDEDDEDDSKIAELVSNSTPEYAFSCLQIIFASLARRFVAFETDVAREVEALWMTKLSQLRIWLLKPSMREFAAIYINTFAESVERARLSELALRLFYMSRRTEIPDSEWPPASILKLLREEAVDLSSERTLETLFRWNVGHGDWRAVDLERRVIQKTPVVSGGPRPDVVLTAREVMRLDLA